MKPQKYKSRKARKRALGIKQRGNEGQLIKHKMVRPILQDLVTRLKGAFGSSKHRKARKARFTARQRTRG